MKNDYDGENVFGYVMGRFVNYGEEIEREYAFSAAQSPSAILVDNPHYTDSRFDKEQTIYGKAQKGLSYDYSDRLWQWDWDKAQNAWQSVKDANVNKHTQRGHEMYLSTYFDKPIELRHIIAGINRSNGYSYLVYGYRDKETK
jgi:hypothetical protein